MSQLENERQASERRMRRLETLWIANFGLFIAAVVAFIVSAPLALNPFRVASLSVLVICMGFALWLRRRFWVSLNRELQQRKRAEQEARAADRARGQFLANVSHEIRTPMHGVLGMADLLLKSQLTAVQREQVGSIRSSAEALLALINDILDLSRIEAGRLELRLRDFRLREMAGDVVRLLTPQAAERDIDLSLHIAPELPDDLHGDPVRLRQVLINLVSNAIRFTRRGEVTVAYDLLDEEDEAPVIRCQVRDTGIGIQPEVQARLFQPFTQADSTSSRQLGGTGLGLVISKSIVELMGGAIGFESTHGVGSMFWFLVPLVRAQAAIPAPPPTVPDNAREAGRRAARRHTRILVVDDHPVNRSLALAQLQDIGYAADTAEGGEVALKLLAERSYDAVLLDCAMPGIDGYETCRRLRLMEDGKRRVPVIAVTAHVMEGDQERCLEAGMDDYLPKPYQLSDLIIRLDRWVGIEMPASDSDAVRIAARLTDLRRLGTKTGEDVLDKVVKAFVGRGIEDLDIMEKALAREDGAALATAAHSLGGSSGLLGAVELARRCAELESLAKNGALASCASPLQAVRQEFREVTHRLAP